MLLLQVVLVVVGVHSSAHGLICPGIVNAQRPPAAVEAATAAVCAAVCGPLPRT